MSKNLSPLKLRPAWEIYPNLSKIKTLITNQIHFHARKSNSILTEKRKRIIKAIIAHKLSRLNITILSLQRIAHKPLTKFIMSIQRKLNHHSVTASQTQLVIFLHMMKVVETVETILLRIDNHNAYTNLDSKSIMITDNMVKSI